MEVVGIRVVLTFEHLSHHYAGKAAGDLLLLLHAVHFNAYGCHRVSNLLSGEIAFQVILEPIVTEFHIYALFFFTVSNRPE